MWVKQCRKPPMTGNGNHTTYKIWWWPGDGANDMGFTKMAIWWSIFSGPKCEQVTSRSTFLGPSSTSNLGVITFFEWSPPETWFWHCCYIPSGSICKIYSELLSGILSGIYSAILSDIWRLRSGSAHWDLERAVEELEDQEEEEDDGMHIW